MNPSDMSLCIPNCWSEAQITQGEFLQERHPAEERSGGRLGGGGGGLCQIAYVDHHVSR